MTATVELRARRVAGYEVARPDLIAHVPLAATRVLDLGCSSGIIGATVKERNPDAVVVGVEIEADYARDAEQRLDRVYCGDAETVVRDQDLGRFDCVIAGDVLEHLRDPWAVVQHVAAMLNPGGTVIVSVPNVRSFQTLLHVGLRGTWPRVETGLFCDSHLRWFTRRDARAMLEGAGLVVQHIDARYKLHYYANKLDGALHRALHLLPARLRQHLPGVDLLAAQYTLVATKPR